MMKKMCSATHATRAAHTRRGQQSHRVHKETPKRKCEEQLESVNGVLAFCCHCFRRVPQLKIALPLNLLQLLRRLSIGRSLIVHVTSVNLILLVAPWSLIACVISLYDQALILIALIIDSYDMPRASRRRQSHVCGA